MYQADSGRWLYKAETVAGWGGITFQEMQAWKGDTHPVVANYMFGSKECGRRDMGAG